MRVYKGFNKKIQAKHGKGTFQYEKGKTYKEEKSKTRYICFLRRREAPGIPFYTIEVEPGGTIRQHRSYYDEEPGIEEIRVFLKSWQKAIRKRLTEEDKKLAKISKIKREANIAELEEKKNIRVLQGLAEDFLEAEEIEKELEAV